MLRKLAWLLLIVGMIVVDIPIAGLVFNYVPSLLPHQHGANMALSAVRLTPTVSPTETPNRQPYVTLYTDHTWEYADLTTPTPEIDVSPTPSPTTTLTPEPTVTPRPSMTPGPSPTPLPLCYGFVTADTLHMRLGPGVSYAIYFKHPPIEEPLHKGDRVGIVGRDGGWYLIGQQPDLYVSAAWIDLAADAQCGGIIPEPPIMKLNTVVGIRTVPGAVGWEAMYPILKAKGIPFGVSPYGSLGYCVSALQQGGMCILRTGAPDCPPNAGRGDPRASAREFMQHAAGAAYVLKGASNVWIEPTNECSQTPMPESQLAWWRDFYLEYIEQAAAQDWPPLAIPGFSPGNGDQLLFDVWKPMFLSLQAHGGIMSTHSYTFQSQAGLCTYDQWEAARHVLQRKYMKVAGYAINIAITEAARQSGAAPVDVDDMLCFIEKVRQEGYTVGVFLWVGGYHPSWAAANLDGHYTEIANRLQ